MMTTRHTQVFQAPATVVYVDDRAEALPSLLSQGQLHVFVGLLRDDVRRTHHTGTVLDLGGVTPANPQSLYAATALFPMLGCASMLEQLAAGIAGATFNVSEYECGQLQAPNFSLVVDSEACLNVTTLSRALRLNVTCIIADGDAAHFKATHTAMKHGVVLFYSSELHPMLRLMRMHSDAAIVRLADASTRIKSAWIGAVDYVDSNALAFVRGFKMDATLSEQIVVAALNASANNLCNGADCWPYPSVPSAESLTAAVQAWHQGVTGQQATLIKRCASRLSKCSCALRV